MIGEEVYRNVVIPKAELQKYYDKHKAEFVREDAVALREILISTGDKSPAKVAAAEKKAKDLVDRARGKARSSPIWRGRTPMRRRRKRTACSARSRKGS